MGVASAHPIHDIRAFGKPRRFAALCAVLSLVVLLIGCGREDSGPGERGASSSASRGRLLVFAGAASKPPTEEVTALFEAETGTKVDLHFGGSGTMLSEMEIAGRGDVFFPGSSDWMEVAVDRRLVDPATQRRVVYLVSAINVQAGNPKGIRSLDDLLNPGVRVVIAAPENVCVGAYAVEILEKNLTSAQIARFRDENLVNWAESCEKTANAVSMKAADAVIGWSCFEDWDPTRVEAIAFEEDQLVRIGYIPMAVATTAEDPDLARRYIEFMTSERSMDVFHRYGYFTDEAQAQAYAGADEDLPVGGWYEVPQAWLGQ